MRILFLSDNFPPEVNAPANRTFEHCRHWAAHGEQVTVITCAPNFPEGKLLAGYRNRIFQQEKQQGILVQRVWSYITANKGTFKRTLDYISFAFSAFIAALFVKTDVIVATSPQFFTACAGCAAAFLKQKPWVFEVRDLWPESIRAVGAMRSDFVFMLLEKLEVFLYRKASLIIVVTDTFKKRLIERGLPAEKIEVVKNGVDLSCFKPGAKDPALEQELGLQGKKVLMYAGTLGMAHAIDFIIKAACKLEEFRDLHFVIMGAGAEQSRIQTLYEELSPKNVSLLRPVPRDQMPRYLSLADYSLVNLKNAETFRTVLPSKIFESAAMQIPIVLGVAGEAKELLESYGAGLAFEPENFESFRSVLLRLMSEAELAVKLSKGAARLAADFDRDRLAERMLELLLKLNTSQPHL